MRASTIRVQGISKRYRIGGPQQQVEHLREAIVDLLAAPYRTLARFGRRPAPAEDFLALSDVSFDVERGEVLGIIGANGAGKSTLLKIISRVTPPTAGRIELRGRVGSLLEVGTGFHPDLTGRENVYLNGTILGMRKREIDRKFDEIVAFAGVEAFIDTPVKRYSSGMFVRLAFSVAAHIEPEILIVDEVLSVGDLHFRNRCLGRMHDLKAQGRTVLFVSHDLTSIRQLCTRALMLDTGRVVEDGTPDEVTRKYERLHQDTTDDESGTKERPNPPAGYHLRRVELRNASGAATKQFEAGEVMEIHLWSSGRAPGNSYTVEFKLHDSQDEVISFGAANPVRSTYYHADQRHFICRLGPLPLTEGHYALSFTVRVWNTERWDFWERAIGFEIVKCDLFGTGHGISNVHDGDFVIPQEWLAGD